MRSSDVTFKTIDADIEQRSGEKKRTMDIIEITFPDGKVSAFPVDEVSPETGVKYRDMYPAKFKAFKDGEADPDRVDQLKREIQEREDELKSIGADDWRVQENLGYGKPQHTPKPNDKRDQKAKRV